MDNAVNIFRGRHYSECEGMVKKYNNYIENSDILDIGSNVGFFLKQL